MCLSNLRLCADDTGAGHQARDVVVPKPSKAGGIEPGEALRNASRFLSTMIGGSPAWRPWSMSVSRSMRESCCGTPPRPVHGRDRRTSRRRRRLIRIGKALSSPSRPRLSFGRSQDPTSHGGDGTAIDHIFDAGDATGSIGSKEGDQAGDFFRFRGSADRNPSERVHDHLLALSDTHTGVRR